jgi:N-acetylmuramate 1-kinase
LLVIQKNKAPSAWTLPAMELSYIKDRLDVFQQWFLKQHLKLPMTIKIQQLVTNLEGLFLKAFTEQPQVLVHLDYHSRNLLVLPDCKPGILDFQDAMIGPITYDLVSLLQDAYISWPRAQVETWVLEYEELSFNAGLISTREHQQFTRSFDLVGLHRHLKNLGVFARLHHRDGKSKYLHDIPILLNYILATCSRYHELQELQIFFEEHVIPQEDKILCRQ